MRTLQVRIQEAANQYGAPPDVVEKDYALSYVLAGLSSRPELAAALVFKGGTALKKLFFGDYRFSEDLDFSGQDAPTNEDLETAVRAAARQAADLLSAYGPFSVDVERHLETHPHPHRQEAFIIRVQFPWHPRPLCPIKVEVTQEELILLAPEKRWLIHGYEEGLNVRLSCYRLEEIVAEKLRTLLQTQQMILDRGWSRPRGRDYYDLWRILEDLGDTLDPSQVRAILENKCEHREVAFQCVDDFFTDELVHEARVAWDESLGTVVVGELPPWEHVLERLKSLVGQLTLMA